ncbi:hypothetical protein [Sulfurovum sp.]|uniref:hypothetical protein n=1 Tax=Sulfurovum sp. TaxID=1969726 RepID=UPI0035673503
MSKIKLLLILAILIIAFSVHAEESKQLRIYISNQSFIKSHENITLVVNGIELYRKILPVKWQHYYETFSVDTTNDTKQWISVVANDTNVSSVFGIDSNDANNDTWVSVEYWYDKDNKRGYFTFATGHGVFLID